MTTPEVDGVAVVHQADDLRLLQTGCSKHVSESGITVASDSSTISHRFGKFTIGDCDEEDTTESYRYR